MKYLAAYLLALLANREPSAETISSILKESDVTVDDSKLQSLLNRLEGKSLEEVLEEGRKKLATVPTGGVASSGAPVASGSSTAQAEEAPAESQPEEEEVCFLTIFWFDYILNIQ